MSLVAKQIGILRLGTYHYLAFLVLNTVYNLVSELRACKQTLQLYNIHITINLHFPGSSHCVTKLSPVLRTE